MTIYGLPLKVNISQQVTRQKGKIQERKLSELLSTNEVAILQGPQVFPKSISHALYSMYWWCSPCIIDPITIKTNKDLHAH